MRRTLARAMALLAFSGSVVGIFTFGVTGAQAGAVQAATTQVSGITLVTPDADEPVGIAVDGSGDVFVANGAGDSVLVIPGTYTSSIFGQTVTPGTESVLNAATGLNDPTSLAIDSVGDLFIGNQSDGSITTIPTAGTTSIFGETVVPNTATTLSIAGLDTVSPDAMKFDSAGDLFIADASQQSVFVLASPTISGTIFGQTVPANTVATILDSSDVSQPSALAFDAQGDLFVGDKDYHQIVVVPSSTTTGTIFGQSVLANNPTVLSTATAYQPTGLAFDSAGNLYIADTSNTGTVGVDVLANENAVVLGQTLTTNTEASLNSVGTLNGIGDLALDSSDNLFVVNSDFSGGGLTELKAPPTINYISPVAGSSSGGGSFYIVGSNLGGVLTSPLGSGVTVSFGGNLATSVNVATPGFITGHVPAGSGTVDVTVTTPGGTSTTSASDQYTYIQIVSPTPVGTRLTTPDALQSHGVAIDSSGDVFVANQATDSNYPNGSVMVIPGAYTNSIFGQSVTPGTETVLTAATGLSFATSVAVDSAGDLFIGNDSGGAIRVIPAPGVTSIFGQTVVPDTASTLSVSGFYSTEPEAMIFDSAGDLFIADLGGPSIKVIPAASGTIFGQSVTANTESTVLSGSLLNQPYSLAFDAQGDLFVGDEGNNDIVVLPSTTTTGTIFGQSVTANTPVVLSAATVNYPTGLAFDSAGNLYIADAHSTVVDVLANETAPVFGQSLTVNTQAPLISVGSLNGLGGLAFDSSGNLFVVDGATYGGGLTELKAPPTIASVSPTSGVEAGGVGVTITGTNLDGTLTSEFGTGADTNVSVSFGGTPATSVQVNSSTSISAVEPSGTGTVDVTVTTPGGATTTSASDEYTYLQTQNPLTVTSPSTLAPGSTLSLTATGGSGSGTLSFIPVTTGPNAGTASDCTISNAVLSASSLGTCVFYAEKAADSSYLVADSANFTVTIALQTQNPLTVTSPSSLHYGSSLSLTATGGSSSGALSFIPVTTGPNAGTASGCAISNAMLTSGSVGTCVFYAEKASDSTYLAVDSSNFTVTISAVAPGAPTALTVSPGDTTVTLSWQAPSSNGGASISGYNVYKGTTSGGESFVSPTPCTTVTATSCTISSLTDGTAYYFVVKAVNAVNSSAASNEAMAIPSGVNYLSFTTQPAAASGGIITSGVAFGVQPIVTVTTPLGATATGSSAVVTLSISPAVIGAALSCGASNSVQASAGVAMFNGCTITGPATATYTLVATATGLTYGTSSAITLQYPAAFTSTYKTTFASGFSSTFPVTTTALNSVTLTMSSGSTLPAGVSFGTPTCAVNTLCGTPTNTTSAPITYPLTFVATTSSGSVSQSFSLIVAPSGQATNVVAAVDSTFGTTVNLYWVGPLTNTELSYTITPYDNSVAQSPITVLSTTIAPSTEMHPFAGLNPGDSYTFSVATNFQNPPGGSSAAAMSNAVQPIALGAGTMTQMGSPSTSLAGTSSAALGSAGTTGSISAAAIGQGTLSVSTYSASPLSTSFSVPGTSTSYDIKVSPDSNFSSVSFEVCNDPSGFVEWYNPAPPATFVILPPADITSLGNNCVEVNLHGGANPTNPTPAQLEGSVFVVSSLPASSTSGGGGSLGSSTQTISFGATPSTATVGSTIDLSSITASSGLAVTLLLQTDTTANTCILQGTSLVFIGAGTCDVLAEQFGNSTYSATVGTKAITVTAKAAVVAPAPTTTTSTTTTATTTTTPPVVISVLTTKTAVAKITTKKAVITKLNQVPVSVTCTVLNCTATLSLTHVITVKVNGKLKKETITLGAINFKLAKGKTANELVTLNKTGKATLANAKKSPMTLSIVLKIAGKTTTQSVVVS